MSGTCAFSVASAWKPTEPFARSYHGNHLDISDECLADSYSWKVQHIREDFKCNSYDQLLRPPITNWSETHNYGYGDCRAGSGTDPTACCVQPKSTVSASRVFLQTGLANVRSFTEAFRASYPVGTRVYPDEAIALADFDGDTVDDIILGNRIFLSTQDRDLSSGKPVPAYGDFSHIEGLTVGNKKFKKVWAGNGASLTTLTISGL